MGLMNKAASSAHMLVLSLATLLLMGVSALFAVARSNNCCKGSMARINNMGERGSPCLRPLKCLYHLPRDPFKRIEVEDDESKEEIHPLHLTPNLKCSSTSIK
jgi:hypothetical protein